MKLIDNFVKKFHDYSLPSPEECFLIEDGDEFYISKWIKKGKINGKMKDIFEWIEKKYFFKKEELKKTDPKKFYALQERFYIKNWRIILLMIKYQANHRYYTKVIESIKDKSFPEMRNNEFLELFEKK